MPRLALLASLALLGCATSPAPPPAGDGSNAMTCQGEALAQFAGQPATQELGARMLALSGARVLRWVAHGSIITMEYRHDRLTVYLTADNRVERANCG